MRRIAALGLILSLVSPAASSATLNTTLIESIDRELEKRFDALVELRRDFHRHAESAGNEERTARVVAERLRELGLEVRTGVGGHGVVAVLRGDKPGPVIGYRADMDAMAAPAADPEDFRSLDPTVNHVCGHDIHTTVGLAVAEVLAARRSQLVGTVKFIFQPAEESATGAKAMLDDGVMEAPTPELFLALHCAPVPVGQLLLLEGMGLPGLELVQIRCSGKGDLEAASQAVVNACAALTDTGAPSAADLDGLIWPPDRPYRVGQAISVEPDPESRDLVVTAMVKASDDSSYASARQDLRAAVEALSLENVSLSVEFLGLVLPAMVNDVELGQRTNRLARQILGESRVMSMAGSVPFFGEDFSFFQQQAPGVLYFLGVANAEKGINGMPHAPDFRADEQAILVGAKAMSGVILGLGAQ